MERRLDFSLERFQGLFIRIRVRFLDVNGPKGGVDKRCHIMAKLRAGGHVIAQGQGTDYLRALAGCLERLARATRKEMARRQDKMIRNKRNCKALMLSENEFVCD